MSSSIQWSVLSDPSLSLDKLDHAAYTCLATAQCSEGKCRSKVEAIVGTMLSPASVERTMVDEMAMQHQLDNWSCTPKDITDPAVLALRRMSNNDAQHPGSECSMALSSNESTPRSIAFKDAGSISLSDTGIRWPVSPMMLDSSLATLRKSRSRTSWQRVWSLNLLVISAAYSRKMNGMCEKQSTS